MDSSIGIMWNLIYITHVILVFPTRALSSQKHRVLAAGSPQDININFQPGNNNQAPFAILSGGSKDASSDDVTKGLDHVSDTLQKASGDQKVGVIMDGREDSVAPDMGLLSSALNWGASHNEDMNKKVGSGALVVPDTWDGRLKESIANGLIKLFGNSDQYTVVHNMDDAKDWVTKKTPGAPPEAGAKEGSGSCVCDFPCWLDNDGSFCFLQCCHPS